MTIDRNRVSVFLDILRQTAQKYPRAYMNCHRDNNRHPERLDYIILATRQAWNDPRLIGPNGERLGMNGKRGDNHDPSSDAVAYGINRDVVIADILTAAGEHGNDLRAIKWEDVTSKAPGILVNPFVWETRFPYATENPPPNTVPQEPPPPKVIEVARPLPWNGDEMVAFMQWLHELYKSDLKRVEGIWIDGHPDYLGLGWWTDVYQKARYEGRGTLEARNLVLEQIRASDEYRRMNNL